MKHLPKKLTSLLVIMILISPWALAPSLALAAGCTATTSPTLDSSTYSASVGSTFTVTIGGGTVCTNQINDNTSGSFVIVPATDTDLDCNGGTCSAADTGAVTSHNYTLKCEAAGTYTINGVTANSAGGGGGTTANSTVTCSSVSVTTPTHATVLFQQGTTVLRQGTLIIN